MAIPLATNHPGNAADASSVNALLSIGPEDKGRIRILVVDDEHTLRESCASVLGLEGYNVTVSGRGQDALGLLKRQPFDIVLADLFMSQVDGLALLRAALATSADTIVIVMTGNPSVESSIEALRQGAWDYLPKPFSAQHLQIMIGRAAHTVLVGQETREHQTELERQHAVSDKVTLLGTSAAFRKAIELARRVAPTDASVFITGESGVGKELIAQFIHQHSRRSSRPFVGVNCAALPEALLESEMFGHRKGAFTGAVRDKPGLLETASGGTLLLDELIEMSKPIQAKLRCSRARCVRTCTTGCASSRSTCRRCGSGPRTSHSSRSTSSRPTGCVTARRARPSRSCPTGRSAPCASTPGAATCASCRT